VSRQRGSTSLELVLLTPALLLLMVFVVFVGRLAEARADVDRAAREAARAGSLARSPHAALEGGVAAAGLTLREGGMACRSLRVDMDVAGFAPGGNVLATVSCTVALEDLSPLRVPGSRTVVATFAQPVDNYRGIAS
jgi:Flp pilus assembly protein TadG